MTSPSRGVPVGRRLEVSVALAPPSFTFPSSYTTLISLAELPAVSPIFWLLQLDKGVENWTEILREQYPERVLVPFAKDRRTDDVFCFDGNDHSGNPAVILIHSFTDPGWEYQGEWLHFDSWLSGLIEFHEEWERTGDAELEPPRTDAGT